MHSDHKQKKNKKQNPISVISQIGEVEAKNVIKNTIGPLAKIANLETVLVWESWVVHDIILTKYPQRQNYINTTAKTINAYSLK